MAPFFDDKIGEATKVKPYRYEDTDSIVVVARELGFSMSVDSVLKFVKDGGTILCAWTNGGGRANLSGVLTSPKTTASTASIGLTLVRKVFQRHGVASRLICNFARSLDKKQFVRIGCRVDERDIPMQCLLRSLGFIAVATLKFEGLEDVYSFEFQLPQPAECSGR